MIRLFCLAIVVWFSDLIPPGPTRSNKSLHAEDTIADILKAIKANSDRIESILYEYQVDYDDDSHPKGYYLRRTIAFKSPHFAYHSTSHGDENLDANDDPFRLFCLMNGTECVIGRPNNGTFSRNSIRPDDPLVGTFPQELGIWAVGIWPLRGRPAPRLYNKHPYVYAEYAESVPHDSLRLRKESINRVSYHVLDRPKIDSIWLDSERNWTTVRREVKKLDSDVVHQRFEYDRFVEVEEGLWLPQSISHHRRVDQTDNDIVNVEVTRYEVNRLDDSFFSFAPPPGAVELIGDRFVQADANVADHLAKITRISQTLISASPSNRNDVGETRLFWMLLGVWASLEVLMKFKPGFLSYRGNND